MRALVLLLLPAFAAAQPSEPAPASSPAPASEPPPKPAAQGPPPEVTLTCTPEPVKVGEPLVCTLTAVHRQDQSVAVPVPPGATELEADAENPAAAQPNGDGRLKTMRRFRLVQMEPKDLRVPAFDVVWTDAAGGEGNVPVEGRKVPVKVLTATVPDAKFRTYREPGEDADGFWRAQGPVPYVKTNWPLIIGLIVLGAAAVGFGVAWLVRRWLERRRRVEAPWVDPRPAHVIALEQLAKLEAERLPEQSLNKEYYFRLSEIVREYLERRYRFGAREMTSDEIRHALAMERGLPDHARLAIEDFLLETDLVKFAGFAPSAASIGAVARSARGLIELTRVPDEPELVEKSA